SFFRLDIDSSTLLWGLSQSGATLLLSACQAWQTEGGRVGGQEECFVRDREMVSTKFIKVNMYVNKRELLSLTALTRLPILAKPVHIYGR
ncbi:MAG: hypothetical protein QM238_11275, partial [Bacteroidota bacterium]|nr:hypothetical protein [Bacteroidota bacterium]